MYCEDRLRVGQRDHQRLKKALGTIQNRSLRANQFIQLPDLSFPFEHSINVFIGSEIK